MSPVAFSALYLPLLLSALALVICIAAFFFSRAYIKRRTSSEWILHEIRDEVNALLKSIDETADRDITLIKERENNLKSLLGEVDKRLKVYIREMEKRREAEETYAALSSAGNEAALAAPEPASPEAGDGTYLDLGKLRYRLKKQEAAAVSSEPPAAETHQADPAPAGAGTGSLPSVNDQIRSFLKEGIPAEKIALRVGVSISEVEFAAALMERQ